METVEVKIQVPGEFSEDIPDLSRYTYEKFVLELYLDGEISLGKAAEMLNVSQEQFIQFLGERNIPYFQATPKDIQKELQKLNSL